MGPSKGEYWQPDVFACFLPRRALAQFGGGPRGPFVVRPNIPYDGRFTFVRLKYTTAPGGYWYGGWPAWGHGHPLSEQNLMRIMNEVSYLSPHTEEINTLALDDPDLFKYPVAYIIEPDWWAMTGSEAIALRAYLQKGGFVIVDDFKPMRFRGGFGDDYGTGWDVFEAAMKRVIPRCGSSRWTPRIRSFTPSSKSIASTSFRRRTSAASPSSAAFRGQRSHKRLQMIIDYNTDVSQFWEWSGTGLRPVDDTNEAYKLGVNYIIYGMMHS